MENAQNTSIQEAENLNNKLTEYNNKLEQIDTTILKKWAGSWIVLVLSILTTITVCCTLGSLITSIFDNWFSIIVALVKLLLNCLVCIGFWRTYAMAKSKSPTITTSGPRMLQGVFKFYMVLIYLVLGLILGLCIVVLIIGKSCVDGATKTASDFGSDISGLNTAFTGALIGILVAVVVVVIVISFFLNSTKRFINDALYSLSKGKIFTSNTMRVAVLFFIMGVITLIGVISSIATTSITNEIFGQLGEMSDIFTNLNTTKLDVSDTLAQIANTCTYIFAGILIIQYGGLLTKVNEETTKINTEIKALKNN